MKLREIGKKLVSAALVVALGMSLTACGSSSSDGEKTGSKGGKLIVGGTYTLSGTCAHAGRNTLKGTKTAVE